jgi:iron complex transport system ATP-binding protein
MSDVMRAHALAVGYPGYTVAKDIEVGLRAGELVCLLGPNGAGKSTLIRTLAGMQRPLSGQVTLLVDGEVHDIHRIKSGDLARHLSLVLTDRVNADLMTVYGLVSLGRHPYTDWSGKLTEDDERIVWEAIEAVGARSLAERRIGQLSDGERQRVMIARALAQQPMLMILDEPTAYLDLPRRVEIMRLLRTLARSTKRAILLSTHDLDLALRSADRLWLLNDGLQAGAPEDLILSGAFEAAFTGEGVVFDPVTGSFQMHTEQGGRVRLVGEGLRALWTRRALERAGYGIADDAPLRLEIVGDEWHLRRGTLTEVYATLYDLIKGLREP